MPFLTELGDKNNSDSNNMPFLTELNPVIHYSLFTIHYSPSPFPFRRFERVFDAVGGFRGEAFAGLFAGEVVFLRAEDFAHEFEVRDVVETSAAGEQMEPDAQALAPREPPVHRVRKERRDRAAGFGLAPEPFFEFR